MPKITRVGVTFPPELLIHLDEVVEKIGYGNRSKAVQDAVRMFISEKEWLQKTGGNQAGILMMLYDHEITGLESALIHVQHSYSRIICSTMHIHISENECLEAIAVKASADEIRRLSDELSTKRGVKLLRTMVVSF
jgi:CopG family nickel-responsive transcriptional regulator